MANTSTICIHEFFKKLLLTDIPHINSLKKFDMDLGENDNQILQNPFFAVSRPFFEKGKPNSQDKP